MSPQKRCAYEILRELLENAQTPRIKMKLMYSSNLNSTRFYKYFSMSLQRGFLERVPTEDPRQFAYQLTNQGLNVLVLLQTVDDLVQGGQRDR